MKFFNQAEGYVEPAGSNWDYVYQYKDLPIAIGMGNIRLSYSDGNADGNITTSEIREENNYYPFGLKHKGYNTAQNGPDHKYGFGGKEEQDELGLQWIDITARNYDAAIGRWMNLDPLAEEALSWSPYNYVYNSPIYFIDSDGRLASSAFGPSAGRIFIVGPNSGGFLSGGGDTYSGNSSFGSSSSGSTGNTSSGSFGQANPNQNDSFDRDFMNANQLKEVIVTLNDESSYTYAVLNIAAQISLSDVFRTHFHFEKGKAIDASAEDKPLVDPRAYVDPRFDMFGVNAQLDAIAAFRAAESEEEGWDAYINAQMAINRSEIVSGGESNRGSKIGGVSIARRRIAGPRANSKPVLTSGSNGTRTINVKGHYRRLPNGRIIWVKPHTRTIKNKR